VPPLNLCQGTSPWTDEVASDLHTMHILDKNNIIYACICLALDYCDKDEPIRKLRLIIQHTCTSIYSVHIYALLACASVLLSEVWLCKTKQHWTMEWQTGDAFAPTHACSRRSAPIKLIWWERDIYIYPMILSQYITTTHMLGVCVSSA